jgi:hypothetical protein
MEEVKETLYGLKEIKTEKEIVEGFVKLEWNRLTILKIESKFKGMQQCIEGLYEIIENLRKKTS